MTQSDIQNLFRFEDESIREEDETLHLSAGGLVDILNKWKVLDSLPHMRRCISDFKHKLRDPQHTLRLGMAEDDNVGFSRNYLFGELDQIVSSLTLERAMYYVERLVKSVSEVRTGSINDINLNRRATSWKKYYWH